MYAWEEGPLMDLKCSLSLIPPMWLFLFLSSHSSRSGPQNSLWGSFTCLREKRDRGGHANRTKSPSPILWFGWLIGSDQLISLLKWWWMLFKYGAGRESNLWTALKRTAKMSDNVNCISVSPVQMSIENSRWIFYCEILRWEYICGRE